MRAFKLLMIDGSNLRTYAKFKIFNLKLEVLT